MTWRTPIWHADGVLTMPARLLGDAERGAVERLLDVDPIAGAQIAEHVDAHGLSWWRRDSRMLGYGPPDRLESLCWLGVNVMPFGASKPATAAFAAVAGAEPRSCASIVGPADGVLDLWDLLADLWGPARAVRRCQPLLVADRPAQVPEDRAVRLARPAELDLLLPAAIAMYTEEVGASPLHGGGGGAYRARIADLIRSRRCYVRFIDGRVAFKAELAVVTRRTAQVQGVWVAPEWRGRGLGVAGMAAVLRDALHRVAPTVSLYVNDYNLPARAVYARCGFRQVGAFATVLF